MGGNATGSGMQFQAKLGALALATMLPARFTLELLQLADVPERAIEVAMETSDAIDDLRIKTSKRQIFVQAKTNLSVTKRPNSEFRKVIDQFVRQHAYSRSEDHFVLIVSSDAGSRVKLDLKKVLDSMRSNQWTEVNTWTKSEKEVAEVLRESIEDSHRMQFNASLRESELYELIAKIWVFEQAKTAEKQRNLLELYLPVNAVTESLWERLYATAEELIRNRMAVTRDGIANRFPELNWNEEAEDLNLRGSIPTFIPAGCEFLLADCGGNLSLMALPRYADDGKQIVSVSDSTLLFKGEEICTVLARGASLRSLAIAMDAIQSATGIRFNGELFAHNYLTGSENLNDSARARSASLRAILKQGPDFSVCLMCGNSTKANGSLLAEFDGEASAIGLVHRGCLDGSVRVQGYWEDERFPVDTVIDLELLDRFEQLCDSSGETAIHGYQRCYPQTGMVNAEWTPENLGHRRGPYVLQLVTAGGDVGYYCDNTQKTISTTKEDAEKLAAGFRKQLNSGSSNYFALGDDGTYGFVKELEAAGSQKREKVTDIVVKREPYFTRQWESQLRFWTPLLYPLEHGEPVQINERRVLFSCPEKVDRFIKANHNNVSAVTLWLIETDAMFDRLFSNSLFDGGELIIDPENRDDGSWDGHIVALTEWDDPSCSG